MHFLPQRLKSTFFEIFLQKTLILAFEVIVQSPITHFLTSFKKVQKQEKSETKIMKITHSAFMHQILLIQPLPVYVKRIQI